jgi:DNA gyrase subunit A
MSRDDDDQRRLRAVREREHLLAGLERAQRSRHEVLNIIFDAEDSDAARTALMAAFGLDQQQAATVLDMQFRRMSRRERERISDELTLARTEIEQTPVE